MNGSFTGKVRVAKGSSSTMLMISRNESVQSGFPWKNLHDHLEATKITMGELAEFLSRNSNLPLVDRTGITGAFNFTLRWNPDKCGCARTRRGCAALRLEVSTLIARQLGLALKFRKNAYRNVTDRSCRKTKGELTDGPLPRDCFHYAIKEC